MFASRVWRSGCAAALVAVFLRVRASSKAHGAGAKKFVQRTSNASRTGRMASITMMPRRRVLNENQRFQPSIPCVAGLVNRLRADATIRLTITEGRPLAGSSHLQHYAWYDGRGLNQRTRRLYDRAPGRVCFVVYSSATVPKGSSLVRDHGNRSRGGVRVLQRYVSSSSTTTARDAPPASAPFR